MRKFWYIPIVLTILFSSCSRTSLLGVRLYDDFQKEIRSREWVSFDVAKKTFEDGELYSVNQTANVIIHNNPNYLAIFYPDYKLFISVDSATYIHDYYQETATYIPGYDKMDRCNNLLVTEIQTILSMLSAYSPIIETQSWTKVDGTNARVKGNGRHYAVKGKQTVKYCTDVECFLVEEPLTFFFDTTTYMLDSVASMIDNDGLSMSQIVYNISYDNKQQLIDSVFTLDSPKYKGYSYQTDKTVGYIYSRSSCARADSSFMDFPFINVETKDTTTLKDLKGWTLMCLLGYYNGKMFPEYNTKEMEELDFLDNIIYVMPYSNRIEETKKLIENLGISHETYCAKMLSSKLNIAGDRYFLISPQWEIVYRNMFMDEEVIGEIKMIVNSKH